MTATVTPIGRAVDPACHTGAAFSPRLQDLLETQRALGYLDGERAGYFKGVRWGSLSWLIVGLVTGILLRHVLGPLT